MIKGGNPANICAIDISKAFDRVNHGGAENAGVENAGVDSRGGKCMMFLLRLVIEFAHNVA